MIADLVGKLEVDSIQELACVVGFSTGLKPEKCEARRSQEDVVGSNFQAPRKNLNHSELFIDP